MEICGVCCEGEGVINHGSCCWYVVESKGIVEGEGKWAPILQKQYEQTELLVMPRALSAGDWGIVLSEVTITTTGA